jgi:DNA-binding protein H-NS
MATLAELLAQKAELERQIAETQRAERATAIAQVRELMAQHGLTLADIGVRPPAGAPSAGPRNKAPVKYRDPATGQTW